MIEKAARERGEQPGLLCRNIILTAFQNSAAKALADQPDLLGMSAAQQQRALLEAFAIDESPVEPGETAVPATDLPPPRS